MTQKADVVVKCKTSNGAFKTEVIQFIHVLNIACFSLIYTTYRGFLYISLKSKFKPGRLTHTCNPSTYEAESEGFQVPGQPGLYS